MSNIKIDPALAPVQELVACYVSSNSAPKREREKIKLALRIEVSRYLNPSPEVVLVRRKG